MFDTNLIFNMQPSPNAPYYISMAIFFSVLIVAATAILLFTKDHIRKILAKYVPPFYTAGGLGFIHLGARYESLPWLASVAFLLLILLVLLVWVVIIIFWIARYVPKLIKEKEVDEVYRKYLPKKSR